MKTRRGSARRLDMKNSITQSLGGEDGSQPSRRRTHSGGPRCRHPRPGLICQSPMPDTHEHACFDRGGSERFIAVDSDYSISLDALNWLHAMACAAPVPEKPSAASKARLG